MAGTKIFSVGIEMSQLSMLRRQCYYCNFCEP